MSDKAENTIVRLLRWIDSGVSGLIERVSRTEQQTSTTRIELTHVIEALARMEARLDRIERGVAALNPRPNDPGPPGAPGQQSTGR